MDERLAPWFELAALSDEEFVERAYGLLVRRRPDADGRSRALSRLGDGTLSRGALLAELASTEEFARVRALDDAIALAAAARGRGERLRGIQGPVGSDERVIEIPWTLARYGGEPRVLDVGYANAEPAYLAALVEACPGEPVGVDLVERDVPRFRSVVADVRTLPFDKGSFDVVFCISTLEHVGLDNRAYGSASERDDTGIASALAALRRVVASNGRVLVTVPCGKAEDHGAFVQREPEMWIQEFDDAGFDVVEHETYVLGGEGWRTAGETAAADVAYRERGPGASAVLCAELRPRGLRARVGRRLRRVAGRR